jgi:hypothetical protein
VTDLPIPVKLGRADTIDGIPAGFVLGEAVD